MSISKRPDGAFVLRWLVGGKLGTYRQKTLRGVTWDDADKEHKKLVGKAAARRRDLASLHPTVKSLSERYLEVRVPEFAESWQTSVKQRLEDHILPVFGAKRAEDLRRADVLRYRNDRRTAGAANATINREVSVLLALLGFAEEEEWLDVNPLPRRRIKPLAEKERTDYFSPEEWEKFRRAFDSEKAWEAHRRKVRNLGPVVVIPDAESRTVKTKRGPRRVTKERRYGGGRRPDSDASHAYRERLRRAVDVFEFLLRTGSRISEALALTWDSVDLERAAIRIYQPKVKAWKEQPIPDELRAVIKRQPRGAGKAPVFQRPGGGPWDSAKLQRAFRVARSISEVNPKLTIHSLRHSAASWLTIAGVPERHVRDILGQKDPRSTRRYSHLRPEHLGGALDVLSKAAGTVEKAARVTRRVTRGGGKGTGEAP